MPGGRPPRDERSRWTEVHTNGNAPLDVGVAAAGVDRGRASPAAREQAAAGPHAADRNCRRTQATGTGSRLGVHYGCLATTTT